MAEAAGGPISTAVKPITIFEAGVTPAALSPKPRRHSAVSALRAACLLEDERDAALRDRPAAVGALETAGRPIS
ncbi:MAG: hypothetical protein LBI84_01375 [Propionibacteriaceae bacterium]|nr:hypothetical protein [Propionibacteriaceae bacterium]